MSAFPSNPSRTPYNVLNQTFLIDNAYEITKDLGQGAYGCVAAATHRSTGESVAIKKITNVFTKKILTKRALREIKLLRHFRGHKNITCLYDMDIIDPAGFNEVYLYEELMEADLHAIIRSGQPLSDAHFQSFIYQTLCGLKYIHSASVLHRDLKPGNLLVNADCELKICDFGLARGFETDPELAKQAGAGGFMTEYVATRWYRAPEIMLSFQNYTTAIDIWSVGCILAELLGGRPIFKGRDYVDQLNQICTTLVHLAKRRFDESVRHVHRITFVRCPSNLGSLPASLSAGQPACTRLVGTHARVRPRQTYLLRRSVATPLSGGMARSSRRTRLPAQVRLWLRKRRRSRGHEEPHPRRSEEL